MWNEGYVSEVDYLHGYFTEISPVRLRLALLSRGMLAPAKPDPAYLELGFGQGVSLAINAVTSSGRFYGTDFNPAQAANARELIDASDRIVEIFDDAFEQLSVRDDLPQFDIIVLHGIWSWISNEARAAIIRLADRKLVAGGIFYVSYNAMPGWAPTIALRQLMSKYSERIVAGGGLLAHVDQSIEFVERLVETGHGYFAANPGVVQRLNHIKSQDRNYLSHEYFNRNWLPMSFLEVADQLFEAKLSFAASANMLDNIPHLAVPGACRNLLDTVADAGFREMVRDYMINQQFRRDIFVKGVRPLAPSEHLERVRDQLFMLTGDLASPPKSVVSAAGEAELRLDIYEPIMAMIAAIGDRPFSIADLRPDVSESPESWQLWEALLILTGAGFIAPVEQGTDAATHARSARLLNAEICRRARYSDKIQYLAASRIGVGVPVSRIEQLFMTAGTDDPVRFVDEILTRQGDYLVFEGAPVTDRDRSRALLTQLLGDFERKKMPMLRRIGAVIGD